MKVNNKNIFVNPLIVTHDGEFHADEVVGISLLKWVYKDVRIIRTREIQKIREADFVLDVGGIWDPESRRFDHHQKSYDGELASAGMTLKWLENEEIIDSKFAEYLRNYFVLGVDMQDNGSYAPKKGICSYNDIISSYNPVQDSVTEYEYLEGFIKALDFTVAFIDRIKLRFIQNRIYYNKFIDALQKKCKMPQRLLILDAPIPPWKEYIFSDKRCDDLLFVIFPESKTKWILHTIPEDMSNPYSNRMKLPEEWGGLLEGEFVKETGIEDAIFCHKQRFMAAFKTKNSALQAATRLIEIPALNS